VPFAGFAAFLWDGIFIGLTMTAEMLLSAVIATIIFFAGWYLLGGVWHNHALWFSFLMYLLFRGLTQTFLFKKRKNILME
jgi:MATE family multidrug resistance protein